MADKQTGRCEAMRLQAERSLTQERSTKNLWQLGTEVSSPHDIVIAKRGARSADLEMEGDRHRAPLLEKLVEERGRQPLRISGLDEAANACDRQFVKVKFQNAEGGIMVRPSEIGALDAIGQAELVRRGEVSALELVDEA